MKFSWKAFGVMAIVCFVILGISGFMSPEKHIRVVIALSFLFTSGMVGFFGHGER